MMPRNLIINFILGQPGAPGQPGQRGQPGVQGSDAQVNFLYINAKLWIIFK
jgi:hypothetical protein